MSELSVPAPSSAAGSATTPDVAGSVDSTGPTAGPSARTFLRPLADRDFRIFWGGESISVLGDQFHFVALAWLVLEMSGSGLALGTILMAAAIPRAILMVFGGAIADRVEPKVLVFRSNALRAVVVGIVAALILSEQVELWQLVIMAVVFGAVDAFFYPAIQTLIPLLMPGERLAASNALFQATGQLIGLVGPAAAGVTVAVVGTGLAFVLDAVSFVVAAVAILLVHGGLRATAGRPASIDSAGGAEVTTASAVPSGPAASTSASTPPETSTEGRPSVWREIRAGAAYTFRDPGLRTLIIMSAALNFAFTGPVTVGLPWLADQRFDAGSVGFGIMISGFGAGALIGAIVAGSLRRIPHRGVTLLVVSGSLGVGLALIGLAPSVAVVTGLAFVMGIGVGFVNVVVMTWVQHRTEIAMLGRVMSLLMLAGTGLAPISLLAAGILIDVHPTALFIAAGALILGAVALGLVWRADRLLADGPAPTSA